MTRTEQNDDTTQKKKPLEEILFNRTINLLMLCPLNIVVYARNKSITWVNEYSYKSCFKDSVSGRVKCEAPGFILRHVVLPPWPWPPSVFRSRRVFCKRWILKKKKQFGCLRSLMPPLMKFSSGVCESCLLLSYLLSYGLSEDVPRPSPPRIVNFPLTRSFFFFFFQTLVLSHYLARARNPIC